MTSRRFSVQQPGKPVERTLRRAFLCFGISLMVLLPVGRADEMRAQTQQPALQEARTWLAQQR